MSTDKKFNVIWIFGDQHRAQMLSCNLDPNLSTPNIDRLSSEGVHFENAISGTPVCCPFRGSLLTSRYPHECVPVNEVRMPDDLPTIAHAFKDQGYHTAYFGKWHLEGKLSGGGRTAHHIIPPERRGGFDTWIGYENNNAQWDNWVHGTGIDEPRRLPGYETDALTDMFISHLESRAAAGAQPFFASLSVQPPHTPYIAPDDWMRRHNPAHLQLRPNVPRIPRIEQVARREMAGACAMVENLDWNVGRIMRALEQHGLADNTYIMFFSDHGDMHGSQGRFRKLVPWEESLRIPFIIGAAGGLGTRYNMSRGRVPAVINHVDIAPTTLGLCGIDKPDWMRGFDYSGYARRGASCEEIPEAALMQAFPTADHSGYDRPWRGIVTTDNWKYVCLQRHPWLMFNLNEDPYEQVNLALDRKQPQRERLHELLRRWITDTGDTFALPE
ncbi:MAG: sulfatase [Kiritimatiellia bacterium]|nr:sulfatase [Lentisphaerota bacterium]